MTLEGKGQLLQNSELFSGTLIDYIDKVSFKGALNIQSISEAATKVTEKISIADNFCRFSNEVGVELLRVGRPPAAVECFELAFRQRLLEEKEDPFHRELRVYAQNYINAVTTQLDSLYQLPSWEQQAQNLKWFKAKIPIFEQAVDLMREYNIIEGINRAATAYRATSFLLLQNLK